MKSVKLLSSLSLNMVVDPPCCIEVKPLTLAQARELASNGVESFVERAATAAAFADQLGVPVRVNRANVALENGDVALVCSDRSFRFTVGIIQWLRVEVSS